MNTENSIPTPSPNLVGNFNSFGYCRIIVNLIGVIVCTIGAILFYYAKWDIDESIYIRPEFFRIKNYCFIAAAILLLIMTIFGFCLAFDISIFFHLNLLEDLKEWYVTELADMLRYKMMRDDPLRAELDRYRLRKEETPYQSGEWQPHALRAKNELI
jgi:hypothetical protein